MVETLWNFFVRPTTRFFCSFLGGAEGSTGSNREDTLSRSFQGNAQGAAPQLENQPPSSAEALLPLRPGEHPPLRGALGPGVWFSVSVCV